MVALPQIQLSFGASTRAWDDRELIAACDAAMEEFHSHHPGPGSWLDKVTAAQTEGRPLPGVKTASSAWYDPRAYDVPAGPSQGPPARKRSRESHDDGTLQEDDHAAIASSANPYVVSTHAPFDEVIQSPRYAPESPSRLSIETVTTDAAGEGDDDHRLVGQPVNHPPPPDHFSIPPAIGGRQLDNMSPQDAISYAMTSQYWAGYWMGVAQILGDRSGQPGPAAPGDEDSANITPTQRDASPDPATRPVAPVTRRHFNRRNNGTLKR